MCIAFGRSDSSLAQCRGMLYQIFNKAAANDLIIKNPVAYADKMRKRPPQKKEAFTADEVRFLMENCLRIKSDGASGSCLLRECGPRNCWDWNPDISRRMEPPSQSSRQLSW